MKNILDLDLNSKVEGKETKNFEPIPAGVYEAVVANIEPWEAKEFIDVKINKKDESGLVVRDENGNIEKVDASFTAYSANLRLKIVSGDYEGRIIFANLTTHPDVRFLLDQFVYATVTSCVLADLQEKSIDKPLKINVGIKEYPKKYVDPNTAIEKTEIKTKNYVKGFYKTALVQDLGI